MPLALELLLVGLAVGQQRGHVEHHLALVEHLGQWSVLYLNCKEIIYTVSSLYLVDAVLAGLAVHCVEAALVAAVLAQVYPLAQHVQKLVHRRGVSPGKNILKVYIFKKYFLQITHVFVKFCFQDIFRLLKYFSNQ